jgi:pimeloyl-ACP methyl ester carboxylesterase
MRRWLVAVAIAMSCALACSSRDGESPAAQRTPGPSPLGVSITGPRAIDQGYPAEFRVEVTGVETPVGVVIEARVDDGRAEALKPGLDGRAEFERTFLAAGVATLRFEVEAAGFKPASKSLLVTVRPRQIVYIQGLNSSSHCPDGRNFSTRAPQWLRDFIFDPLQVDGLVLDTEFEHYFSYSGEWCSDGGFADYRSSDTCAGIDERQAPALKAYIDSLPGGKVHIVAHSMGGLIAAYLVATEPQWARARIASVATFDSPLQGINLLRTGVVGAGGVFDGDCGLNSEAVRDLHNDSSVVKAAREAAAVVPFYTGDATDGEGPTFGQVQAVPGDETRLDGERLHVGFGDDHSGSWTSAGDHVLTKQRFVACAVMLAGPDCLDE